MSISSKIAQVDHCNKSKSREELRRAVKELLDIIDTDIQNTKNRDNQEIEYRDKIVNMRGFFETFNCAPDYMVNMPDMVSVSLSLGMTTQTLRRRLEEQGVSWSGELQALREKVAASLVRNTKHPFEAVSFLCGYSDNSIFYRWFKKTYGVTPKQMRVGD